MRTWELQKGTAWDSLRKDLVPLVNMLTQFHFYVVSPSKYVGAFRFFKKTNRKFATNPNIAPKMATTRIKTQASGRRST